MDTLRTIQSLLRRRHYRFSIKAAVELDCDGLQPHDAIESILNATEIKKTLRSRSPRRTQRVEKLYVIESASNAGTVLYTKGKIAREGGEVVYYFLISAKAARYAD